MVRVGGFLAGLLFCTALLVALVFTPRGSEVNKMYAFLEEPRSIALPSDGVTGHFDEAQLQRGLKVYREVCAACHSMNYVSFRDFSALGYDEDQIKAIAAAWPIQSASINPDTGEAATRAPIPSDRLPSPYANEVAARAANNNALPPDLSLIIKAREGHDDYVYSLLTGYRAVPPSLPAELRPGTGLHYNPYFHSLNIAMAPPLSNDVNQVTFDDGTPGTLSNKARDVTAFLVWAAEPKLQVRHTYGWAILLFLLVATTLAYMSYRTIWADKKGE
jgi:ubiquinol-cytochrome c reductase cytochrome c1 subunit